MEYFDFEAASHGSQTYYDDVASDCIEADESEFAANLDSVRDQSLDMPDNPLQPPPPPPPPAVRCSPRQQVEDVAPDLSPGRDTITPMAIVPASEPCDFCRHMRLDCFVAKSGVMQKSCSCCTSLYRQCSFSHAKPPGKFLDTLHSLTEDVDIPTGSLTGKRALKSLTGKATPSDPDTRRKKSAARFSREVVRTLKNWLREHSQHPYPTEQEKDELEQHTGLNRIQICNWLANARRRGKQRDEYFSQGASESDISLMTPLERWKHLPPENEPVSRSDILRALENTSIDGTASPGDPARSLSHRWSSNDSGFNNYTKPSMLNTPSVSSFETSQSSDISFALSHRSSLKSSSSADRRERRRRHRKNTLPLNRFNQQKSRGDRIFQCTFCVDSFHSKYDWQRHEKSLHLPLDRWTCAPEGGATLVNGTYLCVFCKAPNPDSDHLESHNYSACQEKRPQERTFYRKDHLNQHLRLVHNVKYDSSMEKWRRTITELRSRCGICGTWFSTWNERIEHLATHFRNGDDMSKWEGDWGFEPWVQSLVDNAMPPYLIGQDKKSMHPFSASDRLQQISDPASTAPPILRVPEDSNCFARLERELKAFIHDQLAAGVVPTDLMIQDQGRRIIYDCDDRWNQTCADNPVWLSILKRDSGLDVIPNSDHIQLTSLAMQPPFARDGGLRSAPVETNPAARTLGEPLPNSPGHSGFHFQGPAPQQRSGGPSFPPSMASSYIDNAGAVSASTSAGFSNNWRNSYSAATSSSSVNVDGPAGMDFDPGFLQKLNDSYEKLRGNDADVMDGENFNTVNR